MLGTSTVRETDQVGQLSGVGLIPQRVGDRRVVAGRVPGRAATPVPSGLGEDVGDG